MSGFGSDCAVQHWNECDTPLNQTTVAMTLAGHGVTTLVREGVTYAWEEATLQRAETGEVVDASQWVPAPTTAHDLAAWLGY